MFRILSALAALSALPAFAPAPFPKPARACSDEVSLDTLQGRWRVVAPTGRAGPQSEEGWPCRAVVIKGENWTFDPPFRHRSGFGLLLVRTTSLSLDVTRRPVSFELGDEGLGGGVARGIVRRKGGRVEIVLTLGGKPAADFERPPDEGHYLIVLDRQR